MNRAQQWMADFRTAWNEGNARARIAKAEAAEARGKLRAHDNQRHVRDALAARQPQYAQAVEHVVRELSPRTRGRSR